MARPATGQVIERRLARGTTYALRFRVYGRREYLTLGTTDDGWSRHRAEEELDNVLADVRRGIWRPPVLASAPDVPAVPKFHEFASEWLAAAAPALAPRTVARYRWQLTDYLLPFFHRHRLRQITVAEVDRYRDAKVREQRLSSGEINKTLRPGMCPSRRGSRRTSSGTRSRVCLWRSGATRFTSWASSGTERRSAGCAGTRTTRLSGAFR